MTKFAKILIWMRSKRAAYYLSIIVILCIECVLSWRAATVYYDSFMSYTKSGIVTFATSFVAFIAVLLSGSIISIHRPNNKKVFAILATLAVIHDIGGVFFSIFQNTLSVSDFGDFMRKIGEHPGNTFLVVSLSALGLIPLTLSSVLDEWYNGLDKEIQDQHDKFMEHTKFEAMRIVIAKFRAVLQKAELADLIPIIDDSRIREMALIASNTTNKKQLQSPTDTQQEDDGIYVVQEEEEEEEEEVNTIVPPFSLRGVSRKTKKSHSAS